MKAGRLLSSDEELWELACYHFHQVAEKSLKGFLASLDIRVPRTHDLEELVGRCAEQDVDFLTLQDAALYLEPFYIEPRYPVLSPLELSIERLKAAEEAARRINSLVADKVGP